MPTTAGPSPTGASGAGRLGPTGPPPAVFAPGQVVSGRYRIVGLLGRGGMGEVYRADDLKLGLSVALKFLPSNVASDPRARDRFHAEVRNARQVSHPHVCRVHDIGEVEDRQFLTMEYVDGEDLATLLHRIDRLPDAKALEIARQICAGLHAAHDRGVIHRDLKPANVMIDGHGRARITDFGLAVPRHLAAGELAGTPAYMSPEQLAGEPATVQSDIYALGLVLYEIFTGARPFEATTFEEWRRVHSQEEPTDPSDHTPGFDPTVERVILRCLEKDPARRPRSAAQVALALPGGDPLAAAVAAGETPSPEMVAAAGGEGALSPRAAMGLLGVFSLFVAFVVALTGASTDLGLAPMEKSPEVLRDQARALVGRLGHSATAADSASWLERDYLPIRWLADHVPSVEWRRRLPEIGSPVLFFHRQSPRPLVAQNPIGLVTADDPANDLPGMVEVVVDSRGRLRRFRVTPPAFQNASPAAAPYEWGQVFRDAGLDPERFQELEAQWVPPVPFEQRMEWEGTRADLPELTLRVSGATFGGKPVYFSMLGPWTLNDPIEPIRPSLAARISDVAGAVLLLFVLGTAVFFALRNLRLGRGDRRGATRVALACFALAMMHWLLTAHFAGRFSVLVGQQVSLALALALYLATIVWLLYVAIEPYARRRMPDLLIGWARVLEGRFGDARVGRDVLVGIAFGAATAVVYHWVNGIPTWLPFGGQTTIPSFRTAGRLSPFGSIFGDFVDAILRALGSFVMLFVFRVVFRRTWPGFVGVWFFVALLTLGGENAALEVPGAVLVALLVALVTVRFGLLSAASATLANILLINHPATFDLSLWYAPASLLALALLLGVALWAFRASLGGQSILGSARLDT